MASALRCSEAIPASASHRALVGRAPRGCQHVCPRQQQQPQWSPSAQARGRRHLALIARAERAEGSEGSFTAGFIIGGVVFGALGFLFAPQISKALLGDDQRLRLPRFMDDEQAVKDPEQTKQDLIEKIAQLNASIDEVASQLKAKDDSTLNGAMLRGEVEGIKIMA